MPDGMSAVAVAAEFREELGRLDEAAVRSMVDAWRGVDARLVEEMERFAARLAGQELTTGQLLRMERYRALLVQVERELGVLEGLATGTLEAGAREAALLGVEAAGLSLDALGVAGAFNRLPAAAVQNVVALARAGRPLALLLEPMYGLAAAGIARELVNGLALGLGPREIARRMAADGLSDGLNHLLLVTRDQYNRAHRLAALESYLRSGVVTGYVRRCARQEGRTCVACIALDGQEYRLEAEFEEHPQGRCTLIPLVREVNYDGLGSGQLWFESLGEEEQIATMGRGRWEAWRDGRLPWRRMVRRTTSAVWGTSVTPARIPSES